jgi:uncharacterized protein YneF (UPF0154 family)
MRKKILWVIIIILLLLLAIWLGWYIGSRKACPKSVSWPTISKQV